MSKPIVISAPAPGAYAAAIRRLSSSPRVSLMEAQTLSRVCLNCGYIPSMRYWPSGSSATART